MRISLPESVTEAGYVQPENLTLTLDESRIAPTAPGIVRLQDGDGEERYLALNSFEEKESNLSQRNTLSLPQTTPRPPASPNPATSRSLHPILAVLALLVIGGDLARRILRHVRWGDT
jgi:hypothetical protein